MKRLMTMGLALAAACAVCGAWAEEAATFSTPGPDKYADGTKVQEGECYAIIWTATNQAFTGVTWDFTTADTNVCKVVQILAQADKDSKCPKTALPELPETDGTYEVVLLDTRKTDDSGTLSGLAAGKGDAVVSGWTIIEDETGDIGGWHTAKITDNGTVAFSYNPTKNVADGYGVVFCPADEGTDQWKIYPLPTAYVSIVEPGKVDSFDGFAMLVEPEAGKLSDPFWLDVTYKFEAFTPTVKKVVEAVTPLMPVDPTYGCADFKNFEALQAAVYQVVVAGTITPDEAAEAEKFLNAVYPFWAWNCDYEITFDDDVAAKSFLLGGRYDQAVKYGFTNWVCSCHAEDLEKGEPMRLLQDNGYKGVYVSYYEICSRVQEFLCGVKNLSDDNWGKTITVKLNMYENTGRCNEGGYKATVGTYKYRFDGPLHILYEEGEGAPAGAKMPDAFHGVGYAKSQQLPKPTYDSETMMFAGWTTNGVPFTYIPANFFTKEESPLVLTATWTKADKVDVKVEETKSSINVTEDWVTNNVAGIEGKTGDERKQAIEAELDKKDENGNKKWINYVINQDPNAAIEVVDTTAGDEQTIPVVSNLQAPQPDSGFKVQYSIDKVEGDGTNTIVIIEGEPQDTTDLAINLNAENPTGYYKMNVIVTPEDASETNKVVAETTIGVLKVESAQSPLIVAVPWTSLESTTNVTVSKVIKTSTLSEGDRLHIYSTENVTNFYYSWKVENNAWTPVMVFNENTQEWEPSPDPDTWTIPRGVGMWLERSDVSKPFYLSGLYNSTEATSEIEPPAEEEPEVPAYNLIAPPSIEPTDLNDPKQVEYTGEISTNDQIMVVGGTVPKYYTYKNGKWGYYKKVYKTVGKKTFATQVRVEDDAVIPAGTGAWYVSGGGSPTITWNPVKKEEE